MEKLIDADKALELYNENAQITIDKAPMPKFLWESIVRQTTVEAIPKADYENRLKADLVAMLTELKTEIEEQLPMIDICDYAIDSCVSRHEVASIIQQKINALKENEDAKRT